MAQIERIRPAGTLAQTRSRRHPRGPRSSRAGGPASSATSSKGRVPPRAASILPSCPARRASVRAPGTPTHDGSALEQMPASAPRLIATNRRFLRARRLAPWMAPAPAGPAGYRSRRRSGMNSAQRVRAKRSAATFVATTCGCPAVRSAKSSAEVEPIATRHSPAVRCTPCLALPPSPAAAPRAGRRQQSPRRSRRPQQLGAQAPAGRAGDRAPTPHRARRRPSDSASLRRPGGSSRHPGADDVFLAHTAQPGLREPLSVADETGRHARPAVARRWTGAGAGRRKPRPMARQRRLTGGERGARLDSAANSSSHL